VVKQEMMSNLRENSQQDRRVYVGNLSYDVKWHHLKDFMRQGKHLSLTPRAAPTTNSLRSGRCPLRRRIITSEWNEQGGLTCRWLSGFFRLV
jgi:RNA recognition motif-containing protein